jgi:hypothetical protein
MMLMLMSMMNIHDEHVEEHDGVQVPKDEDDYVEVEDDEVVHDEEVEGAEVDEKDCDGIELQDNDGGKLAMVGAGFGDVPAGANSLTTTWVLGLLALMSWLLAILFARTKETVNRVKASLSEHSTPDEQDNREYFVCKVKTKRGEIMSTNDKVPLGKNMVETYQSGVGKLFHMMSWSRHGVLHRVRKLSRMMFPSMDAYSSWMYKAVNYVQHIAAIGQITKPNAVWDGVNRSFEVARGRCYCCALAVKQTDVVRYLHEEC